MRTYRVDGFKKGFKDKAKANYYARKRAERYAKFIWGLGDKRN
jgi:hypothetical protein